MNIFTAVMKEENADTHVRVRAFARAGACACVRAASARRGRGAAERMPYMEVPTPWLGGGHRVGWVWGMGQ
jgi:hypothetical protein